MEQQGRGLAVPKWVCALSIILGSAALAIQAGIDVYQGVDGSMTRPAQFAQAWQMVLPTGFTLVFAGFGGCLLRASWWKTALCLYVLVAGFMAYTASNSMDFMADQTVARTQAHVTRATVAKDITGIQNETLLKERAERNENLWRTYVTAKTPADKDRVLKEIKESTQDPVALQAPAVEVVALGSGSILNRHLGWRPEAIQEVKALALPVLVMIGKALGITLGFACWPRRTAEAWKASPPTRQVADAFPANVRKLSKAEARADLIAMVAHGAEIGSGRELSQRWGVNEGTVSKWLGDFQREGIIKRQPNGQRRGVVGVHLNGNGRAHAT